MSELEIIQNHLLSAFKQQSDIVAAWVSSTLEQQSQSPIVDNVKSLLRSRNGITALTSEGTRCGKVIALLGPKRNMLTYMDIAKAIISNAGEGSPFHVSLNPLLNFQDPKINKAIIKHVINTVFDAAKAHIKSLPAVLMLGFASFLAFGRSWGSPPSA